MEQKQKSKELIKKDMMIMDIVQKFPDVAVVLTGYGLHCVGCGISGMETLEQGAMGHGMDEETFDMMLRDANVVASGKLFDE